MTVEITKFDFGFKGAINWNRVQHEEDLEIWNKLTSQFWLPEKVPVSNDIPSWATMSDLERETTKKVFAGLTMLDTLQGTHGLPEMIKDAVTPHEEAVYTNISFMESVHAKSYSSIFSTLCSMDEIDDVFRWSEANASLKEKANIVLSFYHGSDAIKRKIASTLLESLLFYSGFYFPLYLASKAKLTNTSDLIKLIIQDEVVHGYYIGMKVQRALRELSQDQQAEYAEFALDLAFELMDNEEAYMAELYDDLGLTNDVRAFMRENANRAMMNLGFSQMFPKDQCEYNERVRSALGSAGNTNHDFFSGSGSNYTMIQNVETTDEDFEW